MIKEGDYVRFAYGCDLWRIFGGRDYTAQVEYVTQAHDGTVMYSVTVALAGGGTFCGSAYEHWLRKVERGA